MDAGGSDYIVKTSLKEDIVYHCITRKNLHTHSLCIFVQQLQRNARTAWAWQRVSPAVVAGRKQLCRANFCISGSSSPCLRLIFPLSICQHKWLWKAASTHLIPPKQTTSVVFASAVTHAHRLRWTFASPTLLSLSAHRVLRHCVCALRMRGMVDERVW